MKKNDKFIGIAHGYTYEGLAVVKKEGFPVFVKDMLEGEEGEIVVTLVKKNFAYGRLLSRTKTSEERVEPRCPIHKQCGGCQLQHMSLKEQKAFKKQRVQDVIDRIAKLDLKVEEVLTMEEPYYYRNKGQVPTGIKDDQVVCGFYRINSNDIIDMKKCLIQHESINQVVAKMKELLQRYQNGDVFRHLLVKVGFKSKEIMLVWIVRDENIDYQQEMIDELVKEIPEIKSIILNLNTRNDNVILGEKEVLLYGKSTITDTLNDLQFNISSKSFYQVNPLQTEVLYGKALEYAQLTGNETVIDLYCGIGTITQFMAKKAKHVIGIEVVPEAIEDAKINATLNQIDNVSFICADAGEYAQKCAQEKMNVDVICVDPPRKGCDQKTLDAIVTMNPKRVVYVSCDPSTLARDLRILEDSGYHCEKVQPVDLFPHTYHIENVCLLNRK